MQWTFVLRSRKESLWADGLDRKTPSFAREAVGEKVRGPDTEGRLPGFEFWLWHFQAVRSSVNYPAFLCLFPPNSSNDTDQIHAEARAIS